VKLLSVMKMKELESAANAGGYGYDKMMVKAGENLAYEVHERFFSEDLNSVIGLVGAGNNGGDTLIALSELQKLGWKCSAIMVKADDQWQSLINKFCESGGRVVESAQMEKELAESQVVLDGVIGTGFKPPMSDSLAEVFSKAAKICEEKIIVAVDCPSGMDCTTGEVSPEALKADLTVSMEAVKEGMVKFPAFDYCGELVTVDLGIPAKTLKQLASGDAVIDRQMVKGFMPRRESNSHKGTFGHVIVCGGSVNYPGAAMLAAKSAYRVGAGLVECAIPERIYEAAVANNLENIFTLLVDEDGVIAENAAATLISKLASAQCLLLGTGIGREETTQRFIQKVIFESDKKNLPAGVGFVPGVAKKTASQGGKFPPIVIDADALHLISRTENWYHKLPSKAVLTPHPGEMSALTGLSIDEIQNDRMSVARKYAMQWQQVVVLKGALTLVASPAGNVAVLPFASSALAKAGTGDVLAGIIAGLIAQGVELYIAAQIGVWMHAQAAVETRIWQGNEYSLLASELVNALPQVLHWL
jgi:hydroxyethylthiazole kinase-like uncharacterized protein yjeF